MSEAHPTLPAWLEIALDMIPAALLVAIWVWLGYVIARPAPTYTYTVTCGENSFHPAEAWLQEGRIVYQAGIGDLRTAPVDCNLQKRKDP